MLFQSDGKDTKTFPNDKIIRENIIYFNEN